MLNVNQIYHKLHGLSPHFLKNINASVYSYWTSFKKYGKYFNKWQNFLRDSQWWSEQELKEFQIERLRNFVSHAYQNSPFYREIIEKKNINIRSVDSLNFIKKFPIINKNIVRRNYNKIKTYNNKRLVFSTSGTTGTSLHVQLDIEAYQREYAFRWQFFSVAEAKRFDKFAYFLGHKILPVAKSSPPFCIVDFYEKSILFSLFHMSDENLISYMRAFNSFEPTFIKGYPSGLYIFANFIKKNNFSLFQPKAVFCASEVLHEEQKELIENVFNCPVFQWYGQVETTGNIHECEYRSLHVKEEYGLLELLKEDGNEAEPGDIANVIGTGFGNKAFPLIRYDTGDRFILSHFQKCSCGRGGRIIEKIVGRDEDIIITPSGRRLGRLDFIFKPVDSVLESQIIQEAVDKIVIKIVPLKDFTVEVEELILNRLKEYIGENILYELKKVDRIPRTEGGKIRHVISKVQEVNSCNRNTLL